ncbi:hypothetical protein ACTJKO_07665 [Curtobacterium sp. 22159]|uniref:hypothetical protein n=1 Tax=Curtobacterium sp. 22159 TaxID=3453882 RepID=UPI003F848C32
MTCTAPQTALPVVADRDGMAVIGRTRHDLMGIRYEEGEGGNAGGSGGSGGSGEGGEGAGTGGEGAEGAQSGTGTGADAQDVASLPQWAQKVISDARADAAKYRTGQQTAQQELADKIAQAIGLKADESTDPAALTQKLTEAQQATAQKDRQLAVFRAAADTKQANALLNRLDFTNSIAGLDPTDGDAFAAAVKAAVDADPSLKAARAAGASTVSPEAGSPEGQPITEAQLAQMTPQQISDAYDKGQLKHLL